MAIDDEFADRVLRRRIEHGLTQEELAEIAGISVRTLREIERGRVAHPRTRAMTGLRLALGLTETSARPRVDRQHADHRTHVGILGPLLVRRDDAPVEITSKMLRRMLALLALQPDVPVSRDEMVDVLWAGQPPAAYKSALHSYLYRLQAALGGPDSGQSMLRSGRSGYLLSAESGQIDVAEFVSLLDRAGTAGDEAMANEFLARALACWRGEVAVDCGEPVYAHPAAITLRRQRADAAIAFADAALYAAPEQVVAAIRPVALSEPFHERLHARLILALAAGGEQHEALAAFEAIRTRLRDELGIEPGAEIGQAHVRVLRQQATSRTSESPLVPSARRSQPPRPAKPAQLPHSVAHFTGRRRELSQLHRLLNAQDRQGGGRTVVATIVGMAGVGKTALAVRWAHEVRDRFPDGQLYLNLRGFDPTPQKLTAADVVRAFLDALDVAGQRIPVDLDAQLGLYRTMLAERRILIVLDNALDADQVRPLIPGASGCLVLVTSRTRMPGLVATNGAHQVTVGLPTPTECRQMFTRRVGQRRTGAEPGVTASIVDRCARLPLALAVAAAHAATRPETPLSTLAADLAERSTLAWLNTADHSSDVHSVFSWSYKALTPAAARLFRLLGLHPGPDVSPAVAAGLAGIPLADAADLLSDLVKAHLVEEHAPHRFQLHDLLREFAAALAEQEDMDAPRQDAMRRMFDHYLHTAVSATLCMDPHRHAITVDPAAEGSTPHTFSDETEALAWFSVEQRALVSATAFAEHSGFERHCWSLAWALATHFVRRGQWRDWVLTQHLGVEAAERAGSAADQAVAHRGSGAAYAVVGRYEEAHNSYQRALELFTAANDNVGLAYTYHDYTWLLDRQERYADALHSIQQALHLDRLAGLRSREARALYGVGHFLCKLGDPRAAVGNLEAAITLCRELEDTMGEATAVDDLGEAYHLIGEPLRAIECYERAVELLRAMDHRPAQAEALDRLGDALRDAGRLEEARAAWLLATDIFAELQRPQLDQVRTKLESLPLKL